MRIFPLYLIKEAKTVNITISFAIFFLLHMFPSLFSQERPQERVTVKVHAVPVRVFHKGEVVKDLKKEDFEI